MNLKRSVSNKTNSFHVVSIPNRDFMNLKRPSAQASAVGSLFQSLIGIL